MIYYTFWFNNIVFSAKRGYGKLNLLVILSFQIQSALLRRTLF